MVGRLKEYVAKMDLTLAEWLIIAAVAAALIVAVTFV